jgi:hypothetical protein
MTALDFAEPDDLQSELNTSWNTGVIAKPTLALGFLGDINLEPNYICIGWLGGDFAFNDLSNQNDDLENSFEITIVASTVANAKLMFGEVRRILNAKTVTNGEWHIENFEPHFNDNKVYFICQMTETIWEN